MKLANVVAKEKKILARTLGCIPARVDGHQPSNLVYSGCIPAPADGHQPTKLVYNGCVYQLKLMGTNLST